MRYKHDWRDGLLPQNSTPPQAMDDCARFADRVAQIAAGHDDVRRFVGELASTFIGIASADVEAIAYPARQRGQGGKEGSGRKFEICERQRSTARGGK